MKTLGTICIIALLSTAVAGCTDSETSRVTVDHDNHKLHPDDAVTLAPNAFACKTKLGLMTAAQHYQKHEFSAWARAVSAENGCFSSPPSGLSWTVYEIDYPAVSVGFASLAQYEAAKAAGGDIDPRGVYWVPSGFVYADYAKAAKTAAAQ